MPLEASPVYQFYRLFCGDNRIRTCDFLLAKQTLYQLSYIPIWVLFKDVSPVLVRLRPTGKVGSTT